MARTVRFHEIGGPEVLRLDDLEIPDPGPGEVRIRTRALGINRAESMFRRNEYLQTPQLPSGLGYEAAGEVDAVGDGVDLPVGAAVSVVPAFAMTDYAVHGELVTAPAHAVVRHPDELAWTDAAALWMMFLTAWGGLVSTAGLGKDDVVLVPAASSSVGLAAIAVAHRVGARAIALSRSPGKKQDLLDAGADAVIVTGEQDIGDEVRRLTDGRGAQVAFDPVGGPTFAELTGALAREGVAVVYGALSPETTPLPVMDVLGKHLTVRGFELFEVTSDPDRRAEGVAFVLDGLRDGELRPVIARTFPLDDIVGAHEYLESNQQFGKIVVTV